jgi:hypothetical protein
MATKENVTIIGSLKAGADLSLKKYRFLTMGSTDLQITGAAGKCSGINATGLNGGSAPQGTTPRGVTGDPIELVVGGVYKLVAGAGGLTKGDYIKSDASGGGVTCVATNIAYAQALATGAAGEVVSVLFLGGAQLTV